MAEKRKISVRKVLQVITTMIVSLGCIIAIAGASKMEDMKPVKTVAIHIRNDKKYHFIEQKEIMDLVINHRKIDIEHTPLSKLDLHTMEKVLLADPWVASAEVYMDNERILHFYITQRIPVARIFQQDKSSYYLDTTMSIMPLSKNYFYYTTVVTNVPELKDDSSSAVMKKQIVSLVRKIQSDSFWNNQVSQVIVDSAGTFELVPVLGDQRILFGDINGMKDKFDNLFAFYKNVLNKIGWDKYETLDLRFKGQVIASPSLPYTGPVDKAVVNMNWINSIVETEARNDSKDSLSEALEASAKEKEPEKPKTKTVILARPPKKLKGKEALKKDLKKTDNKKHGKEASKPKGKKEETTKDKKNGKDKKDNKSKTKEDKAKEGKDVKKDKNGKQVTPKYVYPDKKNK